MRADRSRRPEPREKMIKNIMIVSVMANVVVSAIITLSIEWLLLKVRRPKERFILSMAVIAFLVSMLTIDYTMGTILAVLDIR